MTPLSWLAIPLVLTVLAAVVAAVVGVWPRGDAEARRRRELQRLRRVLQPPGEQSRTDGQAR